MVSSLRDPVAERAKDSNLFLGSKWPKLDPILIYFHHRRGNVNVCIPYR